MMLVCAPIGQSSVAQCKQLGICRNVCSGNNRNRFINIRCYVQHTRQVAFLACHEHMRIHAISWNSHEFKVHEAQGLSISWVSFIHLFNLFVKPLPVLPRLMLAVRFVWRASARFFFFFFDQEFYRESACCGVDNEVQRTSFA